MSDGDLAMLAWCDVGAILRTRPIPLDQLDQKRKFGVGWAAAGAAMTPFDGIVENPWGSASEMRNVPVEGAEVSVASTDSVPAMHLHLTRMINERGEPAEICPRSFCESALRQLESETGWTLWSAFEHEFTVLEAPFRFGPVYSVESMRLAAPFARDLARALRPLELECLEPEFGKGQFEVSCAPRPGVTGPDRAVLTREVIREIARRHHMRTTFAPRHTANAVCSGMHIHFSFRDGADRPVLYDPTRPATISAQGAHFVGGVIRHMGAITALSAPTPASYLRLGPGHWSCGYAAFGVQNREAALRVCPSADQEPAAAAAATNLELRSPDGTCNPYLAIAAIALAGLAGVRERLPLPSVVDRDPSELSAPERTKLGIVPLPSSLPAALDALETDSIAQHWMPPRLHHMFTTIKRMEIAKFADASPSQIAAAYSDIY
jgi:glutamine synthetase